MDEQQPEVSRLRAWRQERGWTLHDIAGLTGFSQPYLSKVERGEVGITAEAKVRVAKQLGATVADLFEPVDVT